MKQSEVYALKEANSWFNRVGKTKRFYHPEYILQAFDRQKLCSFDILECGCSGGGEFNGIKTICK